MGSRSRSERGDIVGTQVCSIGYRFFSLFQEDMPKIDTEGGTDVTDDTNVVAKDGTTCICFPTVLYGVYIPIQHFNIFAETLQESAAQELDQENSEQHAEDSDEAVDSMEPEQSDDLGDLDMSDSEEVLNKIFICRLMIIIHLKV